MANEGYHEPADKLTDRTKDLHRAIVSLMEELEAVDWYQQRVDACTDPDLRAILEHNRDEEKEHAAMAIEWLRRNDPVFEAELKDWLFTDKPFRHAPAHHADGDDADAGGDGDAEDAAPAAPQKTVGDLKGT